MAGGRRLDPHLERLAQEIEAYLRAHDLPRTRETVAAVLTGGALSPRRRRARAAGGVRSPRRVTVTLRRRSDRSSPK